jgi:non-homologous end joining protein Ku
MALRDRASETIIKGYEVGKGQYIEINPEELATIAIEATVCWAVG